MKAGLRRGRTGMMLALWFVVPAAAIPSTVRVRVAAPGRTIDLPLERYVAAVVAGESSVFRSGEALKAMAVAARTYAVRFRGRHLRDGFDFCDTAHCQRADLNAITRRIEVAVAETAGELLWYHGRPALSFYTQDCAGLSESGAAVWPASGVEYLKAHPDSYCTRSGMSGWMWSASSRELRHALERSQLHAPPAIERIAAVAHTPSGRVKALALSGHGQTVRVSGRTFRAAIGRWLGWNTLRSDRYELHTEGSRFEFRGTGGGHGVGLCQRGADQMGLEGKSYRDILAFYYPGTEAGVTARPDTWQRLGSDWIALWTTRPDRDSPVLAAAEKIGRNLTGETGMRLPDEIMLRVYPDGEAFRNATGEPGSVHACASDRRIDLHPATLLRSPAVMERTLRRALLYVLVESHARPGLPAWFRDGLIALLERAQSRAEQSNQAARAVRVMVDRYGEVRVLTWLSAGLPPYVASDLPKSVTVMNRDTSREPASANARLTAAVLRRETHRR